MACNGCKLKCRECWPCLECNATGRIKSDHCAACGGSGLNQSLRIQGKGPHDPE